MKTAFQQTTIVHTTLAAALMLGCTAQDDLPFHTRHGKATITLSSIRAYSEAWEGTQPLRYPAVGQCNYTPPRPPQNLRSTDLWAFVDGDGPDYLGVSDDCREQTGIDCQSHEIFSDVLVGQTLELGYEGGRGVDPVSETFIVHSPTIDVRIRERQQSSDPVIFEWSPTGFSAAVVQFDASRFEDDVEHFEGVACGVDPEAGSWELPASEHDRLAALPLPDTRYRVLLYDQKRVETESAVTYLTFLTIDSSHVYWDPADAPTPPPGVLP